MNEINEYFIRDRVHVAVSFPEEYELKRSREYTIVAEIYNDSMYDIFIHKIIDFAPLFSKISCIPRGRIKIKNGLLHIRFRGVRVKGQSHARIICSFIPERKISQPIALYPTIVVSMKGIQVKYHVGTHVITVS